MEEHPERPGCCDSNSHGDENSSNIPSKFYSLKDPNGPEPSHGYIQSITVSNFKSYIGTYTISPFYRFTSIIGPNASGKSNLLDAFIFILGMPYSLLRVDDPAKLIAPGQTKAAVTLRCEGTDFTRVLTRRSTKPENGGTEHPDSSGCASVQSKFKINENYVSQKEYHDFLRSVPPLEFSKHMIITQARSLHPEIDLLDTLEVYSGSRALIPRYKSLEKEYKDSTRELGVCLDKKRKALAEMKAMRLEEEGKAEFFRLNELRDELEERLKHAEMHRKRNELARLDGLIAQFEQSKKEDGYDERKRCVQALRREAAALQKEYFEKESEYHRGATPSHPEESARASLQAEHNDLLRLLEALDKEIGDFNIEESKAQNISELEMKFRKEVQSEENALSELTMANYEKISVRRELLKRQKELQSKIARNQDSERKRKAEEEKKTERNKILQEELSRLQARIANNGDEYDMIVSEEENKNREMSAVIREIIMNKARKSDASRRAALSLTIRNLSGMFSGVHGRLTDLIRPTQRKYEIAVSTVLAGYESAVIVENSHVAVECVRYVKEARAGRLIFMVLSKMNRYKSRDVPAGLLALKKCVSYDSKYEGLINFIFGTTVLAETLPEAKQILYNDPSSTAIRKAITLDGISLANNGIISKRRTSNAFEDDVIELLLEKRQRIVEDLRRITARKEALAEIGEVKKRIGEIKDTLSEKIEEPEDLQPVFSELNLVEKQLKELSNELADFVREESLLKRKIGEKEREILCNALSQAGLKTLSEYKHKLSLAERRKELATLLARTDLELHREKGNDRASQPSEQARLAEEMRVLGKSLEEAKERLRIEMAKHEPAAAKRRELEQQLLDATLLRIKAEEDFKELQRWCSEESTAQQDEPSEASIANLRRRIKETDERIKALGQSIGVTTGSHASLRLDETNAAYEAARQRTESLKQRFIEIKRERMLRFNECFSKVRAEVSPLYAQLSGSESCRAQLLFEVDPFVNGLKYFLMPAGKGFTEFKDLSGGEKVIALQAFIFALGRYTRIPFYVFDEIDAALDRSHVENLCRFIEGCSEQFLVVSLKPQFYQRSDALVGIYKSPEDGGSKILTYRLR